MTRSTSFLAACALGGVLAAAVACTDRSPLAPPAAAEPPAAVAALQCTVRVREGTLTCAGAPGAAGARAAIFGGQGVNVRLASSGTKYDEASGTLSSNVTVENLTGQALGTRDGVNAAAEGVRVFFHAGPTTTDGSGVVTVDNADGEGAFTAGVQPYFRYAGPLVPGDTTAPREWRFHVPATVVSFAFTVYVAAPVFAEAGWVSVTPIAPSLAVGETQRMEGVLRGVTGRAAAGPPVRWWSSNPAVATVDSAGLVTALAEGAATITATSGDRAGRAELLVTADPAVTWPTLVSFEVLPGTVLAEVDSLVFRIGVKNAHASFYFLTLDVQSPLRTSDGWFCADVTLVSGTADDGVYECRMVMPGWMIRGAWVVQGVNLHNYRRDRTVSTAALRAAGAPWRIEVKNPGDETGPVLDSLSIPQPTATAGSTAAVVNVAVTDTGSGIARVRVVARSTRTGNALGCESGLPSISGFSNVYGCYLNFPAFAPAGAWVVEQVLLEDVRGNRRTFSTAALQAAGYPTAIEVVSPQEDTAPPAVTGFSLSSPTVAANTADSVRLSLSATDAGSGLFFMTATLRRDGGTQTRQCTMGVPLNAPSATGACAFRFNAAETGAWTVALASVQDRAGNGTTLNTQQLAAAGYPTTISVTP
ncbi:Ig-like domain-containing protein [Longimicrobium sp.]|uniref:Ig-like domain-containing protein n=1 Tax=Longimicrobium sp. TaxID=2029185 RepID=UPI002D02E338|nr:Ig-like domain-containing protein [Longimicrobium sp.]HSU14621.1 Ig-like domain-containing protein [Longimicrobium sp.]